MGLETESSTSFFKPVNSGAAGSGTSALMANARRRGAVVAGDAPDAARPTARGGARAASAVERPPAGESGYDSPDRASPADGLCFSRGNDGGHEAVAARKRRPGSAVDRGGGRLLGGRQSGPGSGCGRDSRD